MKPCLSTMTIVKKSTPTISWYVHAGRAIRVPHEKTKSYVRVERTIAAKTLKGSRTYAYASSVGQTCAVLKGHLTRRRHSVICCIVNQFTKLYNSLYKSVARHRKGQTHRKVGTQSHGSLTGDSQAAENLHSQCEGFLFGGHPPSFSHTHHNFIASAYDGVEAA
jgi:hypothetical protein